MQSIHIYIYLYIYAFFHRNSVRILFNFSFIDKFFTTSRWCIYLKITNPDGKIEKKININVRQKGFNINKIKNKKYNF